MRIAGCYLKIIIDDDSDARETFMHRSNKTSNRCHLFLEGDIRGIANIHIYVRTVIYIHVSLARQGRVQGRDAP